MDKLTIQRKPSILGSTIPRKSRIIQIAIKGKIIVGENIKNISLISKYFLKKKIKIQTEFWIIIDNITIKIILNEHNIINLYKMINIDRAEKIIKI